MDVTMFKNMVNKFGEDKIAGIIYNNGYRTIFTDEKFSLAKHLDETIECIVVEAQDPHRVPYKTVRAVELVETLIVVEKPEDMKRLDARYIAG